MDAAGLDTATTARAREELELLDVAGSSFDPEEISAGALTPVYFGSAVRNFGVELLLNALIEVAPPPAPRRAGDREVRPEDPSFAGFIFKIQANMDPRHRDRLAFLRVCSGRFERGMPVINTRTGDRVRLTSSQRVFGREREVVDEARVGSSARVSPMRTSERPTIPTTSPGQAS
ncbi:MAG: EF-Tu/IF-2/RF-3 family GTPase, partial [Pseudomonadota bacterium]